MIFKRFAIGLAIFILTILFIVFVDRAFNPRPSSKCNYTNSSGSYYNSGSTYNYYSGNAAYNSCNSKFEKDLAKHDQTSFMIVIIMSVIAIIGGVLVMAVGPVSWGLILSGLVMILYVLIANYEEVGKPWLALISGVALAILIWLSYAKLGDKERMSGSTNPEPPSPPQETPTPPNSSSSLPPLTPPPPPTSTPPPPPQSEKPEDLDSI